MYIFKISQRHSSTQLLFQVSLSDNFTKLLETYFAVLITIDRPHGLVHNLLQLRVLQIGANHHLQNLE